MHIDVQTQSAVARIAVAGRFEFAAHRRFRDATRRVLADVATREVVVDLGGVDYLDSAALGMLLVLKDRAEQAAKPLSLANCHGAVNEILRVAGFDRIFTIR